MRTSPIKLIIGAVVTIVVLLSSFSIFENVSAQEVMVVQNPLTGNLTWHVSPGIKWQGFGKVTSYQRRSQLDFFLSSDKDKENTSDDHSARIRFNDGGHAKLSGSISFDLPLDEKQLTAIHSKYGSQRSLQTQLIRTVVDKAVYMTGPLMSSKESSAERRNELLRFIEDQVNVGVYRTQTEQTKEPDPLTGAMKTVNIVRIVEKGGVIEREEKSPLQDLGIRSFNLSLQEIRYDPEVEQQIKQQQQMTMAVQTAKAKALEAEQAVITAQKSGEAEAAKAKWEQEKIKATEVTKAEQELAVAKLDREKAEQQKQAQLLRAQGEAEARRLIMSADGALQLKLDTYRAVQERWAQAVENAKSNLTPLVVNGSGSGKGTNVQDLIETIQTNAAIDLGLKLKQTHSGNGSTQAAAGTP